MSGDWERQAQTLICELDALLGARPRLEAPAPEPAPAAAAPAPAAAPVRPARILVVEDSADYREIIRALLVQTGYEVIEASDGREGLASARRELPDLLVLDFEMPELNGYEVIQELLKHEETRSLPVIMLTGARKRDQLRQMLSGISAFLDKPVSNEDFLRSVAHALERPGAPPRAAPRPPPAGEAAGQVLQAPSLEGPEAVIEEDALVIQETKKEREDEVAGLDVLANESPLVNRINKILVQAVDMGASDIHIEPQEKKVKVRVRLHGSLQPLCTLPYNLHPQIAARIKIMSNLIITERRRPQDGQIRAVIRGRKIEFRVSTVPGLHGEKIVMRVLGQSNLKQGLEDMGLREHDLQEIRAALRAPHGLIMVTGPTGSGKTTTLYTMIRAMNTPDVNIMTVEDPVEYELADITQVPVQAQIGVTFETILRSFLRQDPDIMLVGEIRDRETAEIAVKASITGHLVFSTLHTNSAAGAVMRLANMGVPTFLLSDSIKLIVAQRLVKTLCKACKKPAPIGEDEKGLLTPEELTSLGQVYAAEGCAACRKTGFSGRMAVYEVLPVRTPEIRKLVLTAQSMDALAAAAVKEGMTTLRCAALAAVASGNTSLEEAMKVVLGD